MTWDMCGFLAHMADWLVAGLLRSILIPASRRCCFFFEHLEFWIQNLNVCFYVGLITAKKHLRARHIRKLLVVFPQLVASNSIISLQPLIFPNIWTYIRNRIPASNIQCNFIFVVFNFISFFHLFGSDFTYYLQYYFGYFAPQFPRDKYG